MGEIEKTKKIVECMSKVRNKKEVLIYVTPNGCFL